MKRLLDIFSYIIATTGIGSLIVGLCYVLYSKWPEISAISLQDWLGASVIAIILIGVWMLFIASMKRIVER